MFAFFPQDENLFYSAAIWALLGFVEQSLDLELQTPQPFPSTRRQLQQIPDYLPRDYSSNMSIIHAAIFPLFTTFCRPTSCIPNLAAPAALACPKNDPTPTNPPVEGSDPLDTPLECGVPRAVWGQPCPRRVLSSVLSRAAEIPGILLQVLQGPTLWVSPGSSSDSRNPCSWDPQNHKKQALHICQGSRNSHSRCSMSFLPHNIPGYET